MTVINHNEKALRETQTLRAGWSKAEPKFFAPPQTPFPVAEDGQNLISWRWSLPSPRLQTQFGEDRCTQFRVIVVTDPQTNKHTNRHDRLQYTATLSLARSVKIGLIKTWKPLSRIRLVQYCPRRQSGGVLADYGGKDLWKRWVLSLEWNNKCAIKGWKWWAGGRWIECDIMFT